MSDNTNKRTFSVSPHIIFSLIASQAGSLGKAVLECIMNSIDAGASCLDITVTAKALVIFDNGRGFQTKEEIEKFFEVFGFDHKDEQRVFGQFGIGRAQLWNFCPNVWRTNTFSMDVDIKNKGLDYILKEELPQQDGLLITGRFYEPLKPSELLAFERELTELARYAQVPVTLNGVVINKDPASESWTHETADAWIRLRATGELTVYNLGVKVRNFPAYVVGSGGVVVTKPGVRLALNMARNDIVTTECKVWKRIKPLLQAKSDDRIKKSTARLSEDEMQNIVTRVLSLDLPFINISDKKLITDIQGKHHTLNAFLTAMHRGSGCTVAEKGTKKAELAHQLEYAFVITPATLVRFNVENMSELRTKLHALFTGTNNYLKAFTENKAKFGDDYNKFCTSLSDLCLELPDKEQTPDEVAILAALRKPIGLLAQALRRSGAEVGMFKNRTLTIGVSDVASGWTDGVNRIVLNRTLLAKARTGFPGVLSICATLLHEYLHDSSDQVTHDHDVAFYERFESVVRQSQESYGTYCMKVYQEYLVQLKQRKLKILQVQVLHADLLDESLNAIEPTNPLQLLAA
ncbi:MAG: ATP-binding protein [Agitococcus sp.]|nr:ATP-binding protein [Agitococcus sp.]